MLRNKNLRKAYRLSFSSAAIFQVYGNEKWNDISIIRYVGQNPVEAKFKMTTGKKFRFQFLNHSKNCGTINMLFRGMRNE